MTENLIRNHQSRKTLVDNRPPGQIALIELVELPESGKDILFGFPFSKRKMKYQD